MSFAETGVQIYPGVLDEPAIERLRSLADEHLTSGPGSRLAEISGDLEPVNKVATGLIGPGAGAVRAVVFDKTQKANWAVAWHQDRTIVVSERRDIPGFGPWSVKQGLLHVTPPLEILARMITLRVHLDPCTSDNAPLKAALGSHRFGLVPAAEAAARAGGCEMVVSLAEPGDVWAYSTLILHASDRAADPSRRRVIQLDYAAFDLPGGLRWAGLEAYGTSAAG